MLSYIMVFLLQAVNWFKSIRVADVLGLTFGGINFWQLLVGFFFVGSIFCIIWGGSDYDD